jgi:hypothetical protein
VSAAVDFRKASTCAHVLEDYSRRPMPWFAAWALPPSDIGYGVVANLPATTATRHRPGCGGENRLKPMQYRPGLIDGYLAHGQPDPERSLATEDR